MIKPHDLPVYKERAKILEALEKHQVIVVESPTGSGKTTQLPIILQEAGYADTGIIGVTQPRRIATLSVCDYIAKQLDSTVPGRVGYKMRFEDQTDPTTRIKIMTDGILLQEIKNNYNLNEYSVIIVDEAHERSLNIDFILGLLKQALENRQDLKVVISSATINAQIFSEYFDECPVVNIETPVYPVEIYYTPPNDAADPSNRSFTKSRPTGDEVLVLKIYNIIEEYIQNKDKGDILVFLSGEKIIKDCMTNLLNSPFKNDLFVIPLYGRLSKEEQEKVFLETPPGKTKVVISTNIAETSVTIDGITAVIDSGLAKLNYYNPRTFTDALIEGPISRASCNQRKGRAGRTQPGVCYRLYSKKDYEERELFTLEEIYRTDLSEVVLRMAEIGIRDFEAFDFISPPGKQGIMGAVETLHLLKALTPKNELSNIGKMMAKFPLLPRHSRIIAEAILTYPTVLNEVLIATSFISTKSPFNLPPGEEIEARNAHHAFQDKAGDFLTYLKIYRAYKKARKKEEFCERNYLDFKTMAEIVNVKSQLQDIVSDMGVPVLSGGSIKDYLCAISVGLIQFVCIMSGRNNYQSLTAEKIMIHPGSVIFRSSPEFIVAGEVVRTSRTYARSVSPLEKAWLKDISPGLTKALYEELEKSKNKGPGRKRRERERDYTWQIKIGGVVFELQKLGGKKKLAVLPYKKLKEAMAGKKASAIQDFGSLRGTIVFDGMEIMPRTRMNTIIKAFEWIKPEKNIHNYLPKIKNLNSFDDPAFLCDNLGLILNLCKMKKNKRVLGFIYLETNGDGTYWLRCSKSFTNAISTSMASLEYLADELMNSKLDNRYMKDISRLYGKMDNFFM